MIIYAPQYKKILKVRVNFDFEIGSEFPDLADFPNNSSNKVRLQNMNLFLIQ